MRSLISHVDVDRPVRQVYDQWSRLEDLPGIVGSVQEVRRLDERTSHWVVRILGEQREFGAVITEQVPDIRIAWRSDGTPRHAGVVSFHRLAETSTRVTVQLDWEPVGLFDKVGDRLGIVGRRLDADLAALKSHVETQADPAEGRRGTVVSGTAAPASGHGTSRGTVDGGGPGRGAERPTDVPPKGWLQVLKRTFKQLKEDDVPVVAGGVAFFSFLALVPALAAIVSIYGLVSDPAEVAEQVRSFSSAMPRDVADFVQDQITSISEQDEGGLGLAAVIGIAASLWAAAKGFQALIAALTIAYDEEEGRKGWKVKALSLGFTVGVAAVVTAAIFAMVTVGNLTEDLGRVGAVVVNVLRWVGLFALLVVGLAVVYRYAPDRDTPQWRWVSPGALIAALLLVLGSFAFAVYVDNFGSYGETYGPLGAIVVLLLWLYLAAYLIVLGAEMDAELERQTAKDTTEGRREPLGERGAYVADTVAS